MAVALLVIFLSLLLPSCYSRPEQVNKGCSSWTITGESVCCDACHPGHRLRKKCGPRSSDLCTPCEPGTFTTSLKEYRCQRCAECKGAQILIKECTPTSDTQCGCKEGLLCGDPTCSFCVDKCIKGQEPTPDGSCRACPNGTFNDKIHEKCKPWSTKCPRQNQFIVSKANAFTDLRCEDVPDTNKVINPEKPEQSWSLIAPMITGIVLMTIVVVFLALTVKTLQKTQQLKPNATDVKTQPDPNAHSLMAVECSFHEAEQEQGSSLESLDVKDSSEQLVRGLLHC